MRNVAALLLILLLAWSRPAAADDGAGQAPAPSPRDLAVIALLEELELLELVEEIDMLQDMECLTEDDRHEEQD